MPKIKFTVTPALPSDIAHLAYKAGDVLDLPDASCRRWIRRGVAEYVKEEDAPAVVEAVVEPVVADVDPVEPTVEHVVADVEQESEPVAEPATDDDYVLPVRRGRPRR